MRNIAPLFRIQSGVQKSAVAEMAKQRQSLKQQKKARKKAVIKAAKVQAEVDRKAYEKSLAEHEAQQAYGIANEPASVYTKRIAPVVNQPHPPELIQHPHQQKQRSVTAVERPSPPGMNGSNVKRVPPPIPRNIPGINYNNEVVNNFSDSPHFVKPAVISSVKGNGRPPPIPSTFKVSGGPPPIPLTAVQKKLSPYEMSQQSIQRLFANPPPKPKPVEKMLKPPTAEMFGKYVPQVSALKNQAASLRRIEVKPKHSPQDSSAIVGSIFEILNRRQFIAGDESSDENSDDSWSDSD